MTHDYDILSLTTKYKCIKDKFLLRLRLINKLILVIGINFIYILLIFK
jgi:hypothetical protein